MEDDAGGSPRPQFRPWLPKPRQQRKFLLIRIVTVAAIVVLVLVALRATGAAGRGEVLQVPPPGLEATPPPIQSTPPLEILTPNALLVTLVLLGFSAFFSASEVAFFSIHKLRLRAMRESTAFLDSMVARLMEHPSNLLTSILMGNSITNVLLGVVLAAPVEEIFETHLPLPAPVTFVLAVTLCTGVLVMGGEITPKILVVRQGERFARFASVPIFIIDRLMMPLRYSMISFLGLIFRITRFSEVRPAPFMTDDEFKSLLYEGEAAGAIEKNERQMIQGILDFSEVMLREVLVPRPDMVTLPETATVAEALDLIRHHEFSRIPVYRENLDSIVGVLYAKDLLRSASSGSLDRPIVPLLRKAHFVPETMTVAEFMKTAQRLRTHLVIVVDEYGGTEGLATLQDALREVVGDLGDQHDDDSSMLYKEVGDGIYEVEGGFPVDELKELVGVEMRGGEHNTIAGFLMEQIERLLEEGDEIEHDGVLYTVVEMDGRRVVRLRIHVLGPRVREAAQ